ncbi:MAG: hypothetical protein ACJARU_002419 [Congregibacter sp.]|jgi:hypothetical protein
MAEKTKREGREVTQDIDRAADWQEGDCVVIHYVAANGLIRGSYCFAWSRKCSGPR